MSLKDVTQKFVSHQIFVRFILIPGQILLKGILSAEVEAVKKLDQA